MPKSVKCQVTPDAMRRCTPSNATRNATPVNLKVLSLEGSMIHQNNYSSIWSNSKTAESMQ
jgi:hypothetical protein